MLIAKEQTGDIGSVALPPACGQRTRAHIMQAVQLVLGARHGRLAGIHVACGQLVLRHVHAQEQERLLQARLLCLGERSRDTLQECDCARSPCSRLNLLVT